MKKLICMLIFMCVFLVLPTNISAVPGCCSWHGGESGCSGGKTLCSDGYVSNCPCDGTSSSYGNGYSSNYTSQSSSDNTELTAWLVGGIFVVLIICAFLGNNEVITVQMPSEEKENSKKNNQQTKADKNDRSSSKTYKKTSNANYSKMKSSRNDVNLMIEKNQIELFKSYLTSNPTFVPTEEMIMHSIKYDRIDFFNKFIKRVKDSNKSIFDGFNESFKFKYLEYAYVNNARNIINKIIDMGWDTNICPTVKEQNKFDEYIKDKDKWNNPIIINTMKYSNNDQFNYLIDMIKEKSNEEFKLKYDDKYNYICNEKGDNLIIAAIKYNNEEIVQFLLKNNYYLGQIHNGCKNDGITPLEYSIYKKHYKIVKLIVDKGANINYPDKYGIRPIEYAMQIQNIQICKYLYEKGALIDQKDIDNFEYAINKKQQALLHCEKYISIINNLKK